MWLGARGLGKAQALLVNWRKIALSLPQKCELLWVKKKKPHFS